MNTQIFLIVFLIYSAVLSQTDSLNESLKYFPLNIGDYSQYKVTITHIASDSISETRIATSEIIGDTVKQNRKYFIRVTTGMETNIYGNYPKEIIRIDSISGVIYNNNFTKEKIVDSLLATVNDTINSIYVADIYANNILGLETETKLYLPWGTSSYDWYRWELSKNFGLTKMSHSDGVALTKYEYELVYAKINGNEYGVYVGLQSEDKLPNEITLSQNYPNPFNPTTTIKYTIPSSNQNSRKTVLLKIYNVLGNEITTLVNQKQKSGNYRVTFDANDLPSGVYFYKLQSGNFSSTEKMILLR